MRINNSALWCESRSSFQLYMFVAHSLIFIRPTWKLPVIEEQIQYHNLDTSRFGNEFRDTPSNSIGSSMRDSQ